MSIALAATGSPRISFDDDPSEYRAGACNIGRVEITRRWRFGHFAAISGAVLCAILAVAGAPAWSRFVVALPAAVAAACYVEAVFKFCIRFGYIGLFNFGAYGSTTRVADREALARDRRSAIALATASAAIGIGVGAVAVLLPV